LWSTFDIDARLNSDGFIFPRLGRSQSGRHLSSNNDVGGLDSNQRLYTAVHALASLAVDLDVSDSDLIHASPPAVSLTRP